MKIITIDGTLRILLSIGLLGLLYILYLTFSGVKGGIDEAKALAPAGVLLSALIASTSVMKSISSSEKQARKKYVETIHKELNYMNVVLLDLGALYERTLSDIEDGKFKTYSDQEVIEIKLQSIRARDQLDNKEAYAALSDKGARELMHILLGINTVLYVIHEYSIQQKYEIGEELKNMFDSKYGRSDIIGSIIKFMARYTRY